jgi:alkylhydroperoxidase family enzyme
MPPRMTNPSLVVPDALQPLLDLSKAVNKAGVPQQTLDLVRLRVSQINGRPIERTGEADERLLQNVAGWRDATSFGDAERAALALAEAVTRLSDQEDPVSDEVWEEACRHYSEQELGAVVIQIGLVNLWNRINVTTREVPGAVRS